MDCPFCRIAAGIEPAAIVLDDAGFLAFLDRRPLFPGHCLLIPKRHVETLIDLPPEDDAALLAGARLLCSALESGLSAEGTFVAMNNRVSQSVPHLHCHVVPRRKKDGLRGFFWPRQRYESPEQLEKVRSALAGEVARLQKPQKQ